MPRHLVPQPELPGVGGDPRHKSLTVPNMQLAATIDREEAAGWHVEAVDVRRGSYVLHLCRTAEPRTVRLPYADS